MSANGSMRKTGAHEALPCRDRCRAVRPPAALADLGPNMRRGNVGPEARHANRESTHEELPHEVLGLFVEPVRERVVELLDLLPGKILGETLEREPTRDHLVQDAAQRP